MSCEALTSSDVEAILRSCGAFLDGHFVLSSGMHSAHYIEKFRVLERPDITAALCAEFVRRFCNEGIDVVLGAAVGGIILAYETARQLGCKAMFTEREGGLMKLRRGFAIHVGMNVLVVEDIVTTGSSLKEVISVAKSHGANIVGAAVIVDRGKEPLQLDVRFEALLRLPLDAYEPNECPLCKLGIPLQVPGSRHLSGQQ
ncbi:MAG: orotate phosphoribosyltransferase [Armatimonadota bacterium]|nr:orotate phosphoribosyltransferase [Armatimonadota bacterium]MCX7778501.1 orotate phosphoribosyltransferase [Armatimonadota bacterium]MDW8025773.1 orotate phosphoribosyltransferase [Armatimonadota bacterium]